MKKFFLLFTVISTLSLSNVSAQGYDKAIGGRFGAANGISFKTGLSDKSMLELIGNFRSNSGVNYIRITGLYQIYNPIGETQGLNWYYGAGASLGSYKVKGGDGDFYLAANGVIGLDYKFNEVPINISLDWVPALELTPSTGFWGGDIGLGIRYTF